MKVNDYTLVGGIFLFKRCKTNLLVSKVVFMYLRHRSSRKELDSVSFQFQFLFSFHSLPEFFIYSSYLEHKKAISVSLNVYNNTHMYISIYRFLLFNNFDILIIDRFTRFHPYSKRYVTLTKILSINVIKLKQANGVKNVYNSTIKF